MNKTLKLSGASPLFAAIVGFGFVLAAPIAPAQDTPAPVTICHKGKTLTVSGRSFGQLEGRLGGHQRHGDTIGPCPSAGAEMLEKNERLLLSCALNVANHEVVAATSSDGMVVIADAGGPIDLTTVSCAEALVLVGEAGCEQLNVIGTPEAQLYTFGCPSEDDVAMLPDDG